MIKCKKVGIGALKCNSWFAFSHVWGVYRIRSAPLSSWLKTTGRRASRLSCSSTRKSSWLPSSPPRSHSFTVSGQREKYGDRSWHNRVKFSNVKGKLAHFAKGADLYIGENKEGLSCPTTQGQGHLPETGSGLLYQVPLWVLVGFPPGGITGYFSHQVYLSRASAELSCWKHFFLLQ